MTKAVLFKSLRRFDAFREKLTAAGADVTVLDFDSPSWLEHDFSTTDIVVYFPEWSYSSNHPLALYRVRDNLANLHRRYPQIVMFPDPVLFDYYGDKYQQYLFFQSQDLPYPETYALTSLDALDVAERRLGYPLVVKNRYGAGGDYVFRVDSHAELEHYFRLSNLDLLRWRAGRHYASKLFKRVFYYHLIRARRMEYPFVSPPLLAQKFIVHEKDIKTVVGDGTVVEAHWRRKASDAMWKVNIDGGGIGEWSFVPEEVINLSERLASILECSWVNVDIIGNQGEYYVSEFSPVWHHYRYKEKPDFVYKDDYNIGVPLEIALDLERIIVDSLVSRARPGGGS